MATFYAESANSSRDFGGVPSSGSFEARSRGAPSGVRTASLTNYFGSFTEGMPRGVSFEFETTGVGNKRAPSIRGDFLGDAPYGVRPEKRPRLGPDSSGLGGGLSYGLMESLDRLMLPAESAARIVGGIEFGFPRKSDSAETSTIGFFSNPTIPGNQLTLAKEVNYELPGTMDLLFLRQHLPSERQYYKEVGTGDFIDETPRCGRTLQAFNHWLAKRQPVFPSTKAYIQAYTMYWQRNMGKEPTYDHIKDTADEPWPIFSADDILQFFSVAGVIDTEHFATGDSSVGYLPSGRDQQLVSGSDKKINVVTYGRVDTWNIWGAGLEVGTPLYLLIKPMPRPHHYITDSTREMTSADIAFASLTMPDVRSVDVMDLEGVAPQIMSQVPSVLWQVVPWADSRQRHPLPRDLMYTTPFGTTGMGRAIRIGYVMKEDYIPTSSYNNTTMAFNLKAAHQQSIIDIYFQPCVY